ncbi:MAG: hypothetical protein [Bacteriophage sp.]|nr:MAG: hypothetical protein [Bacteriophage sp.]
MKNFKKLLILSTLIPMLSQAATVSWYGPGFHGKRTASGEVFNQNTYTAASNSHKIGTKLRVTNLKTKQSVVVRINDTGGFKKYGRTLDLSKAAFSKIAPISQGIAKVRIDVL